MNPWPSIEIWFTGITNADVMIFFHVYSYIFYRLTKFRDEKISTFNSPFSTIGLMSIWLAFNCIVLILITEHILRVNTLVVQYIQNKAFALLFISSIVFAHWLMFFRITNYKKLSDQFAYADNNILLSNYTMYTYMIFPFLLIILLCIVLSW